MGASLPDDGHRAIRRLPAAVADAIAAGEVVERPASVVKELCENALDAGAGRLDVDIEGGGIAAIRVSDDGSGIAAGELRLAVDRHATSKIVAPADLAAVATLGFRGEALASIAAVADLEITSCARGAGAGGRLRVRASEVVEERAAAPAQGTTVTVRDLFFATPARLRFLRSARSESAACVRVVSELALSHPAVAFSCRAEGRMALRSLGGSLHDACRAVFGLSPAAELIAVGGDGDVAIGGLISQPRAHRGARGGVVLVVNGRRVHNRALLVAVEEAYRGLLPSARHPYGVVTVALDPAEVDVNVHPAKREVRFREEGRVFAALQRACWVALQGAAPYEATAAWVGAPPGRAPARAAWPARLRVGEPGPTWALSPGAPSLATLAPGAAENGEARADHPADPGEGLAALAPLRALGQVGSSWLVAESPRGVVLVDPHAAHEKVLYAELLDARRSVAGLPARPGRSQLLLLPVLVECDPGDAVRLDEHAELLERMGFALEPFGPATLRCGAVPAAVGGADPARLVGDLLAGLRDDGGQASDRDHRIAALVACHGAVRFGDTLAPAEQQRLLERLVGTPGGLTCPHGRPTVMLLEDAALRRAFARPG
ncbi:MAG TPA: DNA mismatch repair endonuclease MutL [Candidatus Dormibacteraeota bacterium]